MAKVADGPVSRHGERLEVLADVGGPSLTRQEYAAECDINALMARYEQHGQWPLMPADHVPQYFDFTSMPGSLQDALNMMMNAETAFMSLPASVRKEFDNNAVRFVEFAEDRANLDQLREWGLAAPEKVEDPPIRVDVVEKPPKVEAASGSPAAPAPGASPKA